MNITVFILFLLWLKSYSMQSVKNFWSLIQAYFAEAKPSHDMYITAWNTFAFFCIYYLRLRFKRIAQC